MDRLLRDVVVRPVQDRDELAGALQLVHDNYVRSGYMPAHPSGIRITPHFALPSTRTYVALLSRQVVATVSLFRDAEMLLPADAVFPDCLAALRATGTTIAEVGMLADRRKAMGRSMVAILQMMKLVFWDVVAEGIDDLVITVNPKHETFYRKVLCFRPMAPIRDYPAVGNAPAALLRVNFASLRPEEAANPQIRDMFLTPPQPCHPRPPYHVTTEDVRSFFSGRDDLLGGLSPAQIAAIRKHHPQLEVSELLRPSRVPASAAAAVLEGPSLAGE